MPSPAGDARFSERGGGTLKEPPMPGNSARNSVQAGKTGFACRNKSVELREGMPGKSAPFPAASGGQAAEPCRNGRERETFPPPLDSRHRDIKTYRNSQGGVQVPTGGEPPSPEAARGRVFKGKAQIRCKSGADGNSPEERERILRLSRSEAFSSLLAPFAALMWTSQGVCHASAIFSLHH